MMESDDVQNKVESAYLRGSLFILIVRGDEEERGDVIILASKPILLTTPML